MDNNYGMSLAEWQKSVERRLAELEKATGLSQPGTGKQPDRLELEIYLPEANIGGLHFNEQKVKGIFDLKDDGKYHCRNILFLSARNTKDDNSRDILSEYLQSDGVKNAFLCALEEADHVVENVDVSLPAKNEGIKQYNGVDWWYWLRDKSSCSTAFFCYVSSGGHSFNASASSVGGVAPVLSIIKEPKI